MHDTHYKVQAASGIDPIDAGFGLVHGDTIIATTDDLLTVNPAPATLELTVAGKTTCGSVAALGLAPGCHEARLEIRNGDGPALVKQVKLRLVAPARRRRRFGARYGSLEYDLPVICGASRSVPWDSLWKTGEFADIVVDFDRPGKFVLWRGMAYAPSWAIDNVMTSLFFGETLEPGVFRDCCEMMSDRECRYSHARIIHNGDARVVIHWRYALADTSYAICRDIWADEVLYVYPDAAAVRNLTMYLDPDDPSQWYDCGRSGRPVPCDMMADRQGKIGFNNMEFITVNAPGATSDDNMPAEALTMMDGQSFSRTFRWPDTPDFFKEPLPDLGEYVFRINYRHRPGIFVASPGEGLALRLQSNRGIRFEAGAEPSADRWVPVEDLPAKFADHIHWPVTRGFGTTPLTDTAAYQTGPTHSFLGYANNAPVEIRDDGAVTWSWFSGIAPDDEQDLRARARAWTDPVPVAGASYAARQGAYIIDQPAQRMTLQLGDDRPAVLPTFVVPHLHCANVGVCINGSPLAKSAFAVAAESLIDSVQTVITLRQNVAPGSRIEITTDDGTNK